jgi:hypothetical protein
MSMNEARAELIASKRAYRAAVWLARLSYLCGLAWLILVFTVPSFWTLTVPLAAVVGLRGLSRTSLWRAGVPLEARGRARGQGWVIADGYMRRQFRRDVFLPGRR